MKIKRACGADDMSSRVLRNTTSSISPFLYKFFNNFLFTGHVPSDWKVSNIVLMPKGADAAQYSDYRPIYPVTILPLVSKILKKLITIFC